MSVIRAFIAISFPPEIYDRLDQVSRQLKERMPTAPVRWVPVRNIHLTIKFLGNVSVANLEVLQTVMGSEAVRHPPFDLSLGELGAFPSANRPRVIWAGIEAPRGLKGLQQSIEEATERLGYTREERPFSPHLTLGRVTRNASPEQARQIGEVVQNMKVGFIGAARITKIHLYRSDLQPGGAVYTLMFSAPLGNPSEN
jgi:2'-5' RNA ligase